ncbi:hypothetical protein [Paenibacillus sp. HW567]|uniref:hypothetical protein n=1 Tax=Paenibacillus sp. HW567 TaxID=1034769 RepID=UPI00037D918F|nr:hypothetical protein [Paenibacillus sp. HW567]
MRSLTAYMLRSYTVSQRYFGPVAFIIIADLILYSYKPNPVMNSYAATAVILFIGAAWMGLSFLNHEMPVQRQVAIVQLGSKRKYSVGSILVLGYLVLVLDLLIVAYPVLLGYFVEPAGVYRIMLAFAGHALLGFLGAAISLYLQASWVSRNSYAAGILLAVLILSVGANKLSHLIPGPFVRVLLPPVAPVMNAMMNADKLPVSALLGSFAHALAYIAVLIGFYLYQCGRKDVNKSY